MDQKAAEVSSVTDPVWRRFAERMKECAERYATSGASRDEAREELQRRMDEWVARNGRAPDGREHLVDQLLSRHY